MSGESEAVHLGYDAVHASGWLSDEVYVNGRIWRCVQAALDAALPARDEEKFLEGARWALRAEGIEDVDRAIENIRDAQAINEEREQR